MGHHGWQGNPPRTEDEARQRIIAATMTCVEQFGPAKTTVSEVAAELGVTRQTVYRYYASHAELLGAVAQAGLEDFVDRMVRHLATFSTPADVAIESSCIAVKAIPPRSASERSSRQARPRSSAGTSPRRWRSRWAPDILRRLSVDWSEIGVEDEELEGLAEILMRLFDSFLQYPADPPRTEDDIRALVRRWLGPALQA